MYDLSEEPEDYLGKAADAKHAARTAIKEKRFDDAWRLLQEQQERWIQHANRFRFTKQQTMSLLSSIHEDMANILRLEGRGDSALVHIVYCLSTSSKPTKSQKNKLGSYAKRSGLDSKPIEAKIREFRKSPDIEEIKGYIANLCASRDSSAGAGND